MKYRLLSYLAVANAHSRLDAVFYAVLLAYGSYLMAMEGRAESAMLSGLILAPIFAGTGLLTTARQGHLDLLFGSGATRRKVWATAFFRAVVLPLAILTICSAWWLRVAAGGSLHACARTAAVGMFTMGIAFAAGLIQPRYLVGVVWAGLRVAFLLSPAGRNVYLQIAQPDQAGQPSLIRGLIGVIGFPETLLNSRVEPSVILILLGLSVAAVALSMRTFLRSDFGGHRTG